MILATGAPYAIRAICPVSPLALLLRFAGRPLPAQAEADARSQREALATETAETDTRLGRDRAAMATERLYLDTVTSELEAKDADLTLREGALRRAFAGYEGE